MKKKIITSIIAIVCVIVAAVLLSQFVFKTETTHIKDVDNDKFEKAYNLLSTSYLDKGEETEVYYTDFIKKYTTIGQGTHEATLKDGVDTNKYYNAKKQRSADDTTPESVKDYNSNIIELDYTDKAEYTVNVDKEGLYYVNVDYMSVGESLSDYTVKMAINGKPQY